MTYKLFLDDERSPQHVTWVNIPRDDDWVVVRNYDEFVACIEQRGLPDFISFDHDLQDFRYDNAVQNLIERTGYTCAAWLSIYCAKRGLRKPRFECHSMNPTGADRIRWLMMMP